MAIKPTTILPRFAGALALAALCAGEATAYDIRTCTFDALTFVDPWSHARFKPDRVGVDIYYACGDEELIIRSPEDPSSCFGPWGDLILEGTFTEEGSNTSQRFLAIYSLHKGTVPCCGWSVFGEGEKSGIEGRTTWLEYGKFPKLSEWPFASIFNSWGSRDDLNGLVALICEPGVS